MDESEELEALRRRREFERLIERSSFGTSGAKAIRARTPQRVVDEVLRRIRREQEHRPDTSGD